ncbi:LarC family nickel insertion protein [Bacillus sp. 37MA]|uniref:LarC family nickel insertion protein n=1 Tax=Bacillus sp. 37MA TaxID=1132442 RepID=UPI00037AE17C|nr:LarC family nickel insertion protein [Bacillus sp. 37MA]
MTTLYFDCFSGMSGDMVIGALLDAGADPVKMEAELKKLQIEEEYTLSWEKVVKNGITATKFDVKLTAEISHSHAHDHDHTHSHDDHSHDHSHDHAHTHSHHHAHRSYKDIVEMIKVAGFNEEVTRMSLAIFKKIGEAEGHIHSMPLEKVHFHEVGAIDSIIDIIGAAILIDQMGITSIKSSPVPVGTGNIQIDHGVYPVPAPATLEMLKGVPIAKSDIRFELTTPTGAAIASVLADAFCSMPSMTIDAIGYGAGTKTFKDYPNVLRVVIGKE